MTVQALAALVVGGAACVALAGAPAAVPADAARPVPSEVCTPGWVCGWTGPDYTGVASFVSQDMPRYPETTAYVGFNDGGSVWNGAATWRRNGQVWGRCVTVYSSTEYQGRGRTVRPGEGIARVPASFGNIHSNRFHTCRLS
ncbi:MULTISPECIES: peptidase inhibitor family I36 protein [unclassified Streptomyces]|uniref:peptidase inhibitor family I36 protein n=1 Tax=unclassified Streptomyces TaxID=2593676 RepID=UPI00131C3A07|nr:MULTISPECIES: peptidase inhibitor family I36 protein [unclassified Streptomyces]